MNILTQSFCFVYQSGMHPIVLHLLVMGNTEEMVRSKADDPRMELDVGE